MAPSLPHRRYNPLSGEWIKVSPQRTARPWQGKQEAAAGDGKPSYDPSCYLCPGNARSGGQANPAYESTFAFPNDFPAILADNPEAAVDDGLFQARPERGVCRVICFSPRHDLTLPRMAPVDVEGVVRLWRQEYRALGELGHIKHVQIFENHGALMGCSNPHPHGQIWAEDELPELPAREDANQKRYFAERGERLLVDYARQEAERGERLVWRNDRFIVVVPYWATWPFETMILPLDAVGSLDGFDDRLVAGLAEAMQAIGIRYDNLFQTDFPYSMGIHQAPTDGGDQSHWQLHLHYYPPLLRSAAIKKFMVGYELMAMAQRDITAEAAAATLRALPGVHYLTGGAE